MADTKQNTVPTENESNNVSDNASAEQAVTFTEAEMRDAYLSGQRDGFLKAVRQIRAEVTDYLINLEINICNTGNQ